MTNKVLPLLMVLGLSSAGCAVYAQPPDDQPPPPPDQGMMEPPQPDYADDAPAEGADVTVNVFYNELTPYGRWVYREGYGQVWVPRVAYGWRPYTTGHWVYTDYGWAWVADEPWGWAAFHYGRWFYDNEIGWSWVPGTVWAPAWVAWRSGGGYVGWAPLPPAVGFRFGVGIELGGGFNFEAGIRSEHFCFVAENRILEPRVATVIVAPERNVTIIRNTTNITNITVVNNRVVNSGISVQHIEQVTGRPVPRLQVAAAATATAGARAQVRAGQVAFYQPPAVARAARQTKAEFGKAGVPAVVQPTPSRAAQGRGRNGGQVQQGQGQGATGYPQGTARSQAGERWSPGVLGGSAPASSGGSRPMVPPWRSPTERPRAQQTTSSRRSSAPVPAPWRSRPTVPTLKRFAQP